MGNKSRFVFNITSHSVPSKLKIVLSEIRLLLTPYREQGKMFERILIVRFRQATIQYLKMCSNTLTITTKLLFTIETTETFISISSQREYSITPHNLNCRSSNVVNIFSWKTYSKEYTGISERFRSKFNNYKSAKRNFIKGNTITQVPFGSHFEDDKHGKNGWEIILNDQSENVDNLGEGGPFGSMKLILFNQMDLLAKCTKWVWCGTFSMCVFIYHLCCLHFQNVDSLYLL